MKNMTLTYIKNSLIFGSIILGALFIGTFVGANIALAQTPSTATCNSMTLWGDVTVNPAGTSFQAWFQWGTTSAMGNTTSQVTLSSTGSMQEFSRTVSSLNQSTTYYYRAMAQVGSQTSQGQIRTITTSSCTTTTQPSVTTNNATNVLQNSATLNGFVNPNGNNNTNAWFEYGTNQSSLNQSTNANSYGSQQTTYSSNISALSPNTTYYYRAVAQAGSGTIVRGSILSFTTQNISGGGNQPSVTTNSATTISQNGATLNGVVSANGVSTTAWFEWGTTQSLGQSTVAQSISSGASGFNYNQGLSSLSPNTVYYYRAVAQNTSGTVQGSILSFTTQNSGGSGGNQPNVTTNSATNVSQNGGTLNGAVSSNGLATSVWFEYGTTQSLGQSTVAQSVGSSASGFSFNQGLSALSPNTTYYYRAVAQNSSGTVQGSTLSFTTQNSGGGGSGAVTVTTYSPTNISEYSATLQGYVNPNGNSNTTAWFEWGTTQSFGFSTNSINYGSGSTNYNQTINNLSSGVTYYYRAVAQSSTGGLVYGQTLTFSASNYGGGGGSNQSPFVTTNNATQSGSFAVLNGYVNPNGNSNTTRWFEWGTSPSSLPYQTIKLSQSYASTFSETVVGLSANTTYYYRAVAQNNYGTVYGAVLSFTTNYQGYININTNQGTNYNTNYGTNYGTSYTTVVTTLATQITNTGARLNGLILIDGPALFTNGWFEWGTSTALGNQTTSKGVGSAPSNIYNEYISGLTNGVTYYYRAVAQNSNGTSYGDIQSFRAGNQVVTTNTTVVRPTTTYVSSVSTTARVTNRVSSSQTGLVALEVLADIDRIARGDITDITVIWRNISNVNLHDVALRVILPEEYEFIDATRGVYSEKDNMVTVDIGTLSVAEEGRMTIRLKLVQDIPDDKVLVTTGYMVYTTPAQLQEEVVAYALQKESQRGSGNVALSFFGEGFFPDTLLGWLILIIILLLLIILTRNLYGAYREDREA